MGQIERITTNKTFPDESFISCVCCIPRAWTLFANERWVRVFENQDGRLELVKEFTRSKIISIFEPLSFTEKISLWLDDGLLDKRFDHLILVAPLRTIKSFNSSLSLPILAHTIAEIDWPSAERKARIVRHRPGFLNLLPEQGA